MAGVIGPVAIVVLLLLLYPAGLFASGAVVSALFGYFSQKDAEERHHGSELIELNK
jgi:hypothetical protein